MTAIQYGPDSANLQTLNALSSIKRKDAANCGHLRMLDGSLVAWKEWQKFEATLTLQNVTQTDRDALLAAIATNDFLLFVFEGESYECLVAEPPQETPDRKTNLYTLELSLMER